MRTMLVLVVLSVQYCACSLRESADQSYALKTYSSEEKERIIVMFANKSLFRRGDLIILETYKNQDRMPIGFRKNKHAESYSFDPIDLVRDSLALYTTARNLDILGFETVDQSNLIRLVEERANSLISTMDSLKIREVVSENSKFGIDLELYFKDESGLIYVSNLTKVDDRWKSFVSHAKKIDQYWYYYPPE